MDLVEVDMVSLQAPQTSLNAVHDVAARGPDVIAPRADAAVDLGRDHDMVPRDLEVLQRLPEDLFALTLRINIRGIKEVDPALNRCLNQLIGSRLANGSDGFEHSSAVPEGHGSEAQFRDQETRIAEGCIFHGVFLLLRVRRLLVGKDIGRCKGRLYSPAALPRLYRYQEGHGVLVCNPPPRVEQF